MRLVIGIILTVLGGGLMVYGLLDALRALQGLYEGATNNAMGMAPTAEQDTSKAMIRAAILGACGVVPFIAGSVMLKVSIFQRLVRRQQVSRGAR